MGEGSIPKKEASLNFAFQISKLEVHRNPLTVPARNVSNIQTFPRRIEESK